MKKPLTLFALLAVLITVGSAEASDLIWSQPPDLPQALFGPSVQTRTGLPIDSEISDDFDLVGTIDRVVVNGTRDASAPDGPVVYGVFVRFYQWSAGVPAALQAEYFVQSGSPGLVYDPVRPATIDVSLPTPFSAMGKHFISVQLVIDDGWYWMSANRGAPRGSTPYQRDNLAGGNWLNVPPPAGVERDGSFQLYGTLSGPARIDSLSAASLTRSGRLRLFGANFGAAQGNSQVLIDGVPAIVSRWSDTSIVAYVPESAALGFVSVQVATGGGLSNSIALDVTARQASGRIRWRFEVDGDYTAFRPTAAPDGTVYVHDVSGRLYALRPDGGLKWIFKGGPTFPSGPPAVGPDGTVYIAMGWVIQAVNPNGTLKWQFNHPNSQGVIGGPAVGPDGKVYAAMDLPNSGVIALSPLDGRLVWRNSGSPAIAEYGQLGLELVFGPSTAGGPVDQFYFACDNYGTDPQGHIYAFNLNGGQRWTIASGFSTPPQTAVGPDGTVSVGVAAYNPSTGKLKWSAYSALGSGTSSPTDVGPDGTVYVEPTYLGSLAALNGQTGAVLWRIASVGGRVGPTVSPLNDVVLVAGQPNFGMPGFFKAFTTGGQLLWQLDMEGTPYPGPFEAPFTRGRFSADGTTVYIATIISGEPVDNQHCYVYALQTSDAPAPSPQLSSLAINPASVTGGSSSQGTVGLSGPAPVEGVVVSLSSSNPSAAAVPATVTVPAGAASATFSVTTTPVSATTAVTLGASYDGATLNAVLTLTPAPPPSVVPSSLSLSPSSVTSGSFSQGTVMLSGPAPSGGALIALASNNTTVATVPASVTVPENGTAVTFTVSTRSVQSSTTVTITASLGGVSKSAALTVTPPPPPAEIVSIQLAEYVASKRQLRVQATSTNKSATLGVYVTSTGQFIGALTNNGGGRYGGQFTWSSNPQNITVRSSTGGTATSVVMVK